MVCSKRGPIRDAADAAVYCGGEWFVGYATCVCSSLLVVLCGHAAAGLPLRTHLMCMRFGEKEGCGLACGVPFRGNPFKKISQQ